MRFTGWTLDAQGRRVEQKLTFTPIDKDTVRQTFEASSDGGKTWATTFDGRYVRRKCSLQQRYVRRFEVWVGIDTVPLSIYYHDSAPQNG